MSVNLSEDLKKVKVLFNYTDEELAQELGINRSTLIRWINNKNYPYQTNDPYHSKFSVEDDMDIYPL